jgi:hypothetical protein
MNVILRERLAAKKQIKVKGDVPKAKATEESLVQTGWKNQV